MAGNDNEAASRLVLLPDLDDELTAAIEHVEELLLEARAWQEEAPGEEWPAPLAGGAALDALRRIWRAVAPGQGLRAAEAGLTGRLLAPSPIVALPGSTQGRPGSLYEHAPLRLADVDVADVATLAAAARVFGDPHAPWFVKEAIGNAATTVYRDGGAEARARLVMTAARIAGLLDLAPDADTELLTAIIGAAGPGADVVLDHEGEAAYERYARRANAMWALSDPLSMYLY